MERYPYLWTDEDTSTRKLKRFRKDDFWERESKGKCPTVKASLFGVVVGIRSEWMEHVALEEGHKESLRIFR